MTIDKARRLLALLDLEAIEENLYRGQNESRGERRLFGGQVLAQAGLLTLATPGTAGDLTTTSRFESQKLAIFVHLERQFGERWTLDGGVRWHDVDLSSRLVAGRLDSVTATGAPRFSVPPTLDGSMKFDNGLGTFGIRYRVDDSAILYFRGAQGHRNGGFDANARLTAAYVPFANEASNNYEIGLRSDWWDNTLRVNLVTYRTWLKDQTGLVRENVGDEIHVLRRNLIEVESRGVELEATYAPNPQLRIDLILAHGKAHHTQNQAPDLENPGTFVDQSDRRPARAPADSATLTARYSWPYASGNVTALARYRYHSDYQNKPALALSKVFNTTTLDVAVAYRWKNWTFTLFSNNVLDKRYPVNVNRVFDSQFVSEPMPGLPLAPATSLPAPTGLLTNMHYNQAKHTGLTINW